MAIPKQCVCTHEVGKRIPITFEDALRWHTMGGTYLEVLGCLGTALGILLGGETDFRTVDAFDMGLETGLTLVLVNLNGTGGGGGRDGRTGALGEPTDSNRSFPVMLTLETLRHMPDFKSSVSCSGFG